jgi:adenine-specific DNA-methyltransferase
MGIDISYMGTKRHLAPVVADVICRCKPGVLLDAFAGMCSVGEQVGPKRRIWSNDIQIFAAEVGRALFTSADEPMGSIQTADLHFDLFEEHQRKLTKMFYDALAGEKDLLSADSFEIFSTRKTKLSKILSSDVAKLRSRRGALFSTTYSDNYFGLLQAIEIDSIIYSISFTHESGQISDDHKRWLILALGRALLKIANSTGHFAEFLKPKQSTYKRFLRQRRRTLWSEWLYSIGELQPSGPQSWRRFNRSFNEDSLSLLPRLRRKKERPAVVYADPPYTDDQYSRYYHLLDTLILYDYPNVTGAGLYRPLRFQTPFSVKSKAVRAFENLISSTAALGADMVLSYPSNGLIHEAGVDPLDLLRKHFQNVKRCCSLPYSHSTFGASKGAAHSDVTELIYLATT